MDFDRKITTFLALTLVLSCEIIYADFGAYYTRLDYEDHISGKYADVVVSVGQNCIDEADPRVPKSDVRMKEICFPEEIPFDPLCYQC